jgi:hypothetical protein
LRNPGTGNTVRHDRLSSLRQRLKRGTFEFGALLEGVSTLDEEPEVGPDIVAEPAVEAVPDAREEAAAAPLSSVMDAPQAALAAPETVEPPVVEPARESVALPEEAAAPTPQSVTVSAASPVSTASNGALPLDKGAHDDRLRAALDSLGRRFSQEAGQFRTAALQMDSEEAGFHLAHVNQILELLSSIDPRAETARQLGTSFAPPRGRTWPGTTWTVAELMESPLSGLLPEDADERFVREILYASWGVTFECSPAV